MGDTVGHPGQKAGDRRAGRSGRRLQILHWAPWHQPFRSVAAALFRCARIYSGRGAGVIDQPPGGGGSALPIGFEHPPSGGFLPGSEAAYGCCPKRVDGEEFDFSSRFMGEDLRRSTTIRKSVITFTLVGTLLGAGYLATGSAFAETDVQPRNDAEAAARITEAVIGATAGLEQPSSAAACA